jgi:hypothetical protein
MRFLEFGFGKLGGSWVSLGGGRHDSGEGEIDILAKFWQFELGIMDPEVR